MQHSLQTGRVVGAESSLSWHRPGGELWSGGKLESALSKRGWAHRLTEWLLSKACAQASFWQQAHPGLSVTVKLTQDQLDDPKLYQKVSEALARSGLPPKLLEIAVDETTVQAGQNDATLRRLADLGVDLSLDDFGAEASICRLSELPIATLKIGPKLGDLAGHDQRGAARLKAAADLSRALNLRLSAVGVNAAGHREFLRSIGCERGQGELYPAPIMAPPRPRASH
jgi:EAL domain-containing protein (putative c-di-GMP-specific phosphodiesterase class I)